MEEEVLVLHCLAFGGRPLLRAGAETGDTRTMETNWGVVLVAPGELQEPKCGRLVLLWRGIAVGGGLGPGMPVGLAQRSGRMRQRPGGSNEERQSKKGVIRTNARDQL